MCLWRHFGSRGATGACSRSQQSPSECLNDGTIRRQDHPFGLSRTRSIVRFAVTCWTEPGVLAVFTASATCVVSSPLNGEVQCVRKVYSHCYHRVRCSLAPQIYQSGALCVPHAGQGEATARRYIRAQELWCQLDATKAIRGLVAAARSRVFANYSPQFVKRKRHDRSGRAGELLSCRPIQVASYSGD